MLRSWIDLVESLLSEEQVEESIGAESRTFYHITYTENLPSILQRGLLPSVGERSRRMGETSAVFMFPSRDEAETALMNWLGEELDDSKAVALLELTLMPEIEVKETKGAEFEVYTKNRIPPECIRVLEKNL